jgi:hypothetical protein
MLSSHNNNKNPTRDDITALIMKAMSALSSCKASAGQPLWGHTKEPPRIDTPLLCNACLQCLTTAAGAAAAAAAAGPSLGVAGATVDGTP